MKHTMYFETQDEYNRYWNGQEPASNYLCIIKKVELANGDVMTNSALTTTNNMEEGEMSDIGTSAITYAYVTTYEYVILEGETTELENSYNDATEQSDIIRYGYITQ